MLTTHWRRNTIAKRADQTTNPEPAEDQPRISPNKRTRLADLRDDIMEDEEDETMVEVMVADWLNDVFEIFGFNINNSIKALEQKIIRQW